jgi:hypothetical protein
MDKELLQAIKTLTTSVDKLQQSVDSNTAALKDLFNSDPHDMMRELNGSLQELIKELENRKRL